MGYRPKPKLYRLIFEDGDYAGLEVTAASLSMGDMLALLPAAETLKGGDLDIGHADGFLRKFGACLRSWNLEDEHGRPVPATYDGLMSQDPAFIMTVLTTWVSRVAAVAPPLPAGSAPSPKADPGPDMTGLPMAALTNSSRPG